ncbi:hypothetical protein D3C73_1395990 [compost metagenome]
MPEQRPPRPLRPNERVFAAHRVEITAPQQSVILILADEWQYLHGEGLAHMHSTRCQALDPEPTLDIAQNPPFRHQQVRRQVACRHHVQPTGQPRVLVGKQRDQLRTLRRMDP